MSRPVYPRRYWTKNEELFLTKNYPGLNAKELSLWLNRTEASIHKRILKLKIVKYKKFVWTRKNLNKLYILLDKNKDYESIARNLNTSIDSIKHKVYELNISLKEQNHLSIRQVSILLGVRAHTISDWCIFSIIKAYRYNKINKFKFIEYTDLLDFLDNEKYWNKWEPEKITDVELREYYINLRKDKKFLTTKQVGNILGYHYSRIVSFIHEHKLRACRYHGLTYAIREDHLQEYINRNDLNVSINI